VNKFLENLEKAFAIFGLCFFTGVLTISFGETVVGAIPVSKLLPDIAVTVMRYFVWGGAGILLCLRWRNALIVAKSDLFLWMFTILAVLSPFWSDFPDFAVPAIREVIQMTMFGWYLASRFSIREQVQLFGITLMLSAFLSVFLALVVPSAAVHKIEFNGAWRGVFGHKNELGSRMVMAAMICLLYITDRPGKRLAWLGFWGANIVIFFCNSKGAWAWAVLMPLIIYLCRTFRWRGKSTIVTLDLAILFLSGLVSAIVANWVAITGAFGKSADISGRIPIWVTSLGILQERPWFGFGRGAFWAPDSPEAIKVGMAVAQSYVPPHSHNGFVDILLDVGWIGFALFMTALIVAFVRAGKLAYYSTKGAYIWPFVFLVFLVSQNMVESLFLNLANIYWTLFVATALSLKDAVETHVETKPKLVSPPGFALSERC
jgi:exopolysaccharide production protein ExoQ